MRAVVQHRIADHAHHKPIEKALLSPHVQLTAKAAADEGTIQQLGRNILIKILVAAVGKAAADEISCGGLFESRTELIDKACRTSAGNVRYKGNPKDIRIHSKGVQKID